MPAREAAERSLARAVVGVNKTAGTALLARIRPADHLHPDPGVAPGGARAPVLRTVASRTWRCSSSGSANRRKSHLAVLELRFCEPSQVAPGGARAPALRTRRTAKAFGLLELLSFRQSLLAPGGAHAPALRTRRNSHLRCSSSGSANRRKSHLAVLQLRFCEPSHPTDNRTPKYRTSCEAATESNKVSRRRGRKTRKTAYGFVDLGGNKR